MNTPDPNTASAARIPLTAARLAIVAMIAYHVLLVVLILLRPDLDPSWHTISEWAIGPHGWLMSTAFFISALSYGCLFVAIRSQVRGRGGRIGRALLLVCTLGTVGVGLFTTDPFDARALSTRGLFHIITGTTALVLLPVAALLINLSLARRNEAWSAARPALLWTAGLPLLGFAGFAVYTAIFVAPLGRSYGPGVNIGWPPRVAFWTYAIWLLTLAWHLAQERSSAGASSVVMSSGSRRHPT